MSFFLKKPGLIFQIHNSLNSRPKLNQKVQFNVEGWNKKNINSKTLSNKKNSNKRWRMRILWKNEF
jgi:hypothetical protein